MAMITCVECKGSISSQATACPHCGAVQASLHRLFCPQCGEPNAFAASLCSNCKTTLESARARQQADDKENARERASTQGSFKGGMIGMIAGGVIMTWLGISPGSIPGIGVIIISLIGGQIVWSLCRSISD